MDKCTLQKLFCLEGLFLDRCEVHNDRIDLYVRSPRTSARCPECTAGTEKVHRTVVRSIKHMVCDGKIAYLKLAVRNFACRACPRIFRESVPGIDRRRTSGHFRQSVLPKARDRSFRSVAVEHALSTSSLIRSAADLAREVGVPWPMRPFALGIDEHSFAGRDLMITITDVTHRNLLAILPNDRKATLEHFLETMPISAKNRITSVCIDMNSSYREAALGALRNAPVVIDKFHVIQYCNVQLEELRQLYTTSRYPLPKKLLERNREDLEPEDRRRLATMFRRYGVIEEMWRLKEWFRALYRLTSKAEAARRYDAVLAGLASEARPRWQVVHRTLTRWREYILNYFDHRITNAYTEGVHTRIKLLKRISYGFRNKQNYIAKMTLAFLPLATLLAHLHSSPSLT